MYLDHLIDIALGQGPAVEPRRVSRFEPQAAPPLERDTIIVDGPGVRADAPPAPAIEPGRGRQAQSAVDSTSHARASLEPAPGRRRAADPEPASPAIVARPAPVVPAPVRPSAAAREPSPEAPPAVPGGEPAAPAVREIRELTERTHIELRASPHPPAAREVVHERELVREIETRLTTEPSTDVRREVARALAALPRQAVALPDALTPASTGPPAREPAPSTSVRETAPRRPPAPGRRVEAWPAPAAEPHVHVTIGRVEVRATTSASRAPRRADGPRLRLGDYLRRREGR
jgi:hypothetical protein